MKRLLITIALFFTLQAGAQTELIDVTNYIKLDKTLYKSEDGKTIVRFFTNSFTAQCTGKEIDNAYHYAVNNMDYKGEVVDNEGRLLQVFENEKYRAEFYIHKTRLLTVKYK